jgi:hypothetical protein
MLADERRGVCWKIGRGCEWVDGVASRELEESKRFDW